MSAKDLSILIPARNEEFLSKTIEDILSNIEADTEVIAVLDGAWADPAISQHPRVVVVYLPESIGQRASTNLACKLSKAKYVAKVDAHCSFDKGFDRKMLDAFKETGDNVVMVPVMRNLHCFDWVCKCGFTHYQDKGSMCPECKQEMTKKMIWQPRRGTRNYAYCFDAEPHFQYMSNYRNRKEFKEGAKIGLTETMSLQGSFFMMTREKYWELNIGDEKFGSWGSQGIQIACSFWLTGGRVMVNHKSWYSHMFRTKQANGFGFPYPQSGRQVDNAKKYAGELFFENKFPNQTRSLSWLIKRFAPIPGWGKEELARIKRFDLPAQSGTFVTTPTSSNGVGTGKLVPSTTEGLPGIESGRGISSHHIVSGKSQNEMGGVATMGSIAKVVENLDVRPSSAGDRTDEPRIHKTVDVDGLMAKGSETVAIGAYTTSPEPAPSNPI